MLHSGLGKQLGKTAVVLPTALPAVWGLGQGFAGKKVPTSGPGLQMNGA